MSILPILCYLRKPRISIDLTNWDVLLRYECVDEPWNVDTANVVTCPDTDDQGRPLFCHTFTQQIKGIIDHILTVSNSLMTFKISQCYKMSQKSWQKYQNVVSTRPLCFPSFRLRDDDDVHLVDVEELSGGDG